MKARNTHGMRPDREAQIMTLAEAAEYLRTSYSTVYRLVVDGELNAFRLRNAWRTSTAACDEYVRRQFAEQAIASRSSVVG